MPEIGGVSLTGSTGDILTTSPVAPTITAGDDGSNDSSGILSGMGDLFAGVGAGIASGLAASNISRPTTVAPIFNPQTGLYYNPQTGQAITPTGGLTSVGAWAGAGSGNTILLLGLGLLAILFLSKRRGSSGE